MESCSEKSNRMQPKVQLVKTFSSSTANAESDSHELARDFNTMPQAGEELLNSPLIIWTRRRSPSWARPWLPPKLRSGN
jgi:hypothetical protein